MGGEGGEGGRGSCEGGGGGGEGDDSRGLGGGAEGGGGEGGRLDGGGGGGGGVARLVTDRSDARGEGAASDGCECGSGDGGGDGGDGGGGGGSNRADLACRTGASEVVLQRTRCAANHNQRAAPATSRSTKRRRHDPTRRVARAFARRARRVGVGPASEIGLSRLRMINARSRTLSCQLGEPAAEVLCMQQPNFHPCCQSQGQARRWPVSDIIC